MLIFLFNVYVIIEKPISACLVVNMFQLFSWIWAIDGNLLLVTKRESVVEHNDDRHCATD